MTRFYSYKYFDVELEEPDGTRKTPVYRILNRRSDSNLGRIMWYGRWRQFCFFPHSYWETVWSAGCLVDVRDAMAKISAEYKSERAAAKAK